MADGDETTKDSVLGVDPIRVVTTTHSSSDMHERSQVLNICLDTRATGCTSPVASNVKGCQVFSHCVQHAWLPLSRRPLPGFKLNIIFAILSTNIRTK